MLEAGKQFRRVNGYLRCPYSATRSTGTPAPGPVVPAVQEESVVAA